MKTKVMVILAVLVAAVMTAGNARAAEQKQDPLLEVLQSGAPAEKAIACKQLAIYGDAKAAPALGLLLADEQLSSWARIALEAIPGAATDDVLRDALDRVQGRLLIGVINSLGVRRDPKAVEPLVSLLKNADVDVASAAAVALGHIGGDEAAGALEQSLAATAAPLRSAAAEGCILCAEQKLAEAKTVEAIRLLGAVRKADVPKQRALEAARGLIVAQGKDGMPILVELLRSNDKAEIQLAFRVVRELPAKEVTDCLIAELGRADASRQGLIILALADRGDASALPAVLQVAKTGPEAARSVALAALAKLGDASCVPVLLEAALGGNEPLAQTALTVLADLPGSEVDADLAARLAQAQGKSRAILIDIAGRRAIAAAVPTLLKAADDRDPQVRAAALTALGATIELNELPVLIDRVAKSSSPEDAAAAEKALSAALERMPDRDAATQKVLAGMSSVSVPVKCRYLEILSTVGGPAALRAVGAAAKDADPQLQDTGSRLLGDWMDLAAAPVLLDLAKNAADDRYKIRAMRGYIRMLRQFDIPNEERARMCRLALAAAQRVEEKKLILEVVNRNPSGEMLALALDMAKIPELKNEAVAAALLIADQTGSQSAELRKMLTEMGHGIVKIEIIKAEYGAGSKVKDVTTILRKHVHDFPVIILPSPSYNSTFGGDPAPGVVKHLKVQYRMDGKLGEASFAENASIQLPKPQ